MAGLCVRVLLCVPCPDLLGPSYPWHICHHGRVPDFGSCWGPPLRLIVSSNAQLILIRSRTQGVVCARKLAYPRALMVGMVCAGLGANATHQVASRFMQQTWRAALLGALCVVARSCPDSPGRGSGRGLGGTGMPTSLRPAFAQSAGPKLRLHTAVWIAA